MEGLFLLKEMLLPGDFICKINLKDAQFEVPISKAPGIMSGFNRKACYTNFHVRASDFPPSAESFHQINESSNIFASESLYKNYDISRRYALDSSFSRETTNCLGYVDISVSDLEIFNHHSKVNIGSDIDFGVSMIISRFTEYDTKSTKIECGKDKHAVQKDSREVTRTVRGLRKLIE